MTALSFPGVSDAYAQNVIGTFSTTADGLLAITLDAPLPSGYIIGRVNLAEDDDLYASADAETVFAFPVWGTDDWRVYAYGPGSFDPDLSGSGTYTLMTDGVDCVVHEQLTGPGDDVTLEHPYLTGSVIILFNAPEPPTVEEYDGDLVQPGDWEEVDPGAGTLTILASQVETDVFDFWYIDADCGEPAEGPGVFAEFDGTWEKLPVMDWHVQRGVTGDLAGNSSPGSGIFTIQNPDDRYNPENEASPLAGFLKDGVRVWVGVNEDGTVDDGKTVLGVFAGYITDIEPMPVVAATVSPTVVITCADPLEWMGRQPVRLPDSRTRSQADLRAEVLDAIGWTYGTDLPAEPTTLPLSSADGLAGNILDSLNRASGTRHYIKPATTRSAWATYTAVRRTSLLDAVTVAAFDAGSDHVTGTSGWRRSADGVINQQKATVTPVDFPGRVFVWEPELLPFTVTGELVIWTEFSDYVEDPLVDVDYTGSALTTAIEPFGHTAKVTLTSAGTSVVTDLDITGYLVQRGSAASVVVDDTASQAGVRGIRAGADLSSDYLGTLTSAHGIAAHIVYRFAEPLGRPTVTLVNWLPEQYARDLLQLVGVTVAELAVTDKVYEIVGLTHDGEMAAVVGVTPVVLHTSQIVLQESREQTDPGWFILDDSLLDGSDVLAY